MIEGYRSKPREYISEKGAEKEQKERQNETKKARSKRAVIKRVSKNSEIKVWNIKQFDLEKLMK